MICAFPLGSTVMPARGVPLWSVRPKVARRGCRARRSIVARSEGTPDRLEYAWATDGHTGAAVPIFARGPGASRFASYLDNADVGQALLRLLE